MFEWNGVKKTLSNRRIQRAFRTAAAEDILAAIAAIYRAINGIPRR